MTANPRPTYDWAHKRVIVTGDAGFLGRIVWDTRRPNGQPRQRRDPSRAEQLFGSPAHTSFADGLRRTVDWHRASILQRQAQVD